MKKKVLVIYYSQTGQLKDIAYNFITPFRKEQDIDLDIVEIEPEQEYTFPWTGRRFFSVMPDSVLEKPIQLKEPDYKHEEYDLVILGYQPWFLSPSLPTTSLVRLPSFQQRVKGTPVVTLIGARNMWINAHEKVKAQLNTAGALLKGNVVLVDRNQNLLSVASILHWQLNGKKEKYMGIFPKPGIAEEDIKNAHTFGAIVLEHFKSEALDNLQNDLVENKAVEIKDNLMLIEGRGSKIFKIWAKQIDKKKNKSFWLNFFKYYLIFALVFIAPIVVFINLILRPVTYRSSKRKRRYFLGLN